MPEVRPQLAIRPADASEYAVVGRVTVAAYESLGVELGGYADVLRDVAGRADTADVLVAEEDGRIVGAVTYVPGPASGSAEFDDPDAAGVRFLAVAPNAQGRGTGLALLRACIERARQAGRARVVLHTTQYMQTARLMYARAGFVRDSDLDLSVENGLRLMAYRYELA